MVGGRLNQMSRLKKCVLSRHSKCRCCQLPDGLGDGVPDDWSGNRKHSLIELSSCWHSVVAALTGEICEYNAHVYSPKAEKIKLKDRQKDRDHVCKIEENI